MIPLSWFLLAWLVLAIINILLVGVTLMMHLRYGVTGFGTYLSALVFVGVAVAVLLITAGYLVTVDWNQGLELLPGFSLTVPTSF